MRVALLTLVAALALGGAGRTGTRMLLAQSRDPTFDQLLAQARQDMATKEGSAYDIVIGKQFASRHARDVGACVDASAAAPDPFKLIVVVGDTGKVTTVTLSAETPVATCIRKVLEKEKFPKPPFAPFHDLIEMAFR